MGNNFAAVGIIFPVNAGGLCRRGLQVAGMVIARYNNRRGHRPPGRTDEIKGREAWIQYKGH
ncbi:MAG: hypothetical protein HQK97_07670 [Nitrospirae bacterium]|nr:hypothetical protein [Nitrospirota bacterium]